MKIAVLLSGNGVYDGSEIHESVACLLALNRLGVETICIAPDIAQHHVINHLTGEQMPESRNILVEAARLARGNIVSLSKVSANDFDALVMPGGFGVAKNFTKWAFQGADGEINADIKQFIAAFLDANKPIAALCMSPTTLAKVLEGSDRNAQLTVGNIDQNSPYDIAAIQQQINKIGSNAVDCDKDDVIVDDSNNIVTCPCYMMEASISEVFSGVEKAINKLVEMTVLYLESQEIS